MNDTRTIQTKFRKINKWLVTGHLRHLSWQSTLLIVIGFALVVIPRVANLGEFVVFDEPLYWRWTNQFFKAVMAGDWANTLLGLGNPGITVIVIQMLGLIVRYFADILTGETSAQALAYLHLDQPVIVFGDLAARRLPMALLNVAFILLLLFLVYRQFGQKVTIVATILLGFDAFLLSDSRTMRGDAMMSVLMTISAITLLIYLTEGGWRYLLFSSLAAAVSFANKFSMLAMAPFVLLMVGIFVYRQAQYMSWRSSLWAGLLCLVIWGVMSPLVLWLIWPAFWVIPGDVIAFVAQFAAGVSFEGRKTFFMGQVYTNELLPHFYLVLIPMRISPLVMVGLVAGLFSLRSKTRHSALARPWLTQSVTAVRSSLQVRAMLTIGALLVYAVSVWLIMTLGVLKRDHYVMPVFPALDILGAVGLVWLIAGLADKLSLRWPHWSSQGLVGWGLGLILIVQAAISIPHHPYYYSYYNPFIFGPLWAHRVTMINWGPDLGEAARYLNTLEHAESLKVASATIDKFIPEFKGTTIRFVYDEPWIQADYIVIPYEDVQFPKINPPYYAYALRQPLVYKMILGGVPFGWIYRGPAAQYYAGSKLDGLGLLLGYNLDRKPAPAGSTVSLKLFWQNDGHNPDDLFFVRLLNADGYIWTEALPQPLPDYTEAAITDNAIVESQANLEIPPGTPPGVYFLSIGFRSAKTGETLGVFPLPTGADKLTVIRPANELEEVKLPIDHILDKSIAPDIKLLGYSLPHDLLVRTEPNWLTLFWQAETATVKDYVMALQLLDMQGQEVTYWLGRPVMSGYPTTEWLADEIVRDPWRLDLPAELPSDDYTLQLALFDAETETKVNQVSLGKLAIMARRQRFDLPAMESRVNAKLGSQITLLGYDLSAEPITGGGRLRVTLYWQAQEIPEGSYTVFVHLFNSAGALVAQHDGLPVKETIPTNDWIVGEVITDQHLVEFANLPPGDYKLMAGMYDANTGERLPVVGGDTAIQLQTLPIGQ